MTQDTTMGNLETWVRQLNGELNVSEVAKTIQLAPFAIIRISAKFYRTKLGKHRKIS